MSYLFPRFACAPTTVRYAAPSVFRHDFAAPILSLLDDSLRELNALSAHHQQAASRRSFYNPRFDLKEDKESYVLEGEVPGFQESDLSIEWHNNTLAVRGRHESVKESGTKPVAAVEAGVPTTPAAVQDGIVNAEAATESTESTAIHSHQATVEDEVKQPANASAVAEADATEVPSSSNDNEHTTLSETPAPSRTVAKQAEPQHWISERTTGQFLRQFRFPSDAVNQDAIKASLESGILRIVVPKHAQPTARKINID